TDRFDAVRGVQRFGDRARRRPVRGGGDERAQEHDRHRGLAAPVHSESHPVDNRTRACSARPAARPPHGQPPSKENRMRVKAAMSAVVLTATVSLTACSTGGTTVPAAGGGGGATAEHTDDIS